MKYSAAIGVGLITALTLSACGKNEQSTSKPAESAAPAASSADVVVKIGHVAPLSGSIAHLGKDNENGARMALDDINAKGTDIGGKKVKFELVPEDDQADAKTATVVAQKLVDAKVAGVVGHLNSGTTIPASKIYSDAGIPQISGSATNPKYTQQGFKTAFRVMANDVQQGAVLGNYIVKDLKGQQVAIVDDRTAYGQGLADEVEKAVKSAGGNVVAREFTNDKATDFKAILTNIKSKKPDVIFHGGMDATGAPMLKQMRELGINAQFVQGDGGCSPEFIKLAGPASEGFKCSQAGLPIDRMANAKDFKERFEKKYGQIQIYSPYTYDATMVMVAAMKRANSTDPAKYLSELPKTSYDGVTGKIEFDDKGDLKSGYITLYEVKSGKLEVLSAYNASDILAPAAPAAPAAAPAPAPAATPAKQ